jgi:hypothetical protein
MINLKKYSIEKIVVALLLVAGVLLSLFQFLYNRSLWFDEAMLALNIINKNAFELLKPLDYDQVAPILFLLIEKLFSIILPNTEYGLRLFPLLCFWASLYFFYKIVKMQLNNIYAVIMALSLFVSNFMFIYYSGEVKQYMVDVFVLLFTFYFVLKDYKKEEHKFYILGAIGIFAIFLSNVAPIILFTCGLYLFYDELFVTKRKRIRYLLIVFAVWLGVFSVYYCLFIYAHPAREYMVKYWSFVNAFLPHNSVKDFLTFLIAILKMLVRDLYVHHLYVHRLIIRFFVFLFLTVGVICLFWYKKVKLTILICTPLLLHLFLSTFQMYPFSYRLILYIFPGIIIICSIGFGYITKIFANFRNEKIRHLAVFVKPFIALAIPILFCSSQYNFPYLIENSRESIKYVRENIKEDESIYVYYFVVPVFKYYNDIGFINIKTCIIEGKYNTPHLYTGNMRELDNLHGKNWLLFDDKTIMINHIDSLGHRKIKEFKTKGASAYLYDFGE